MAHFPKPFFRNARNAWFAQVGTKQVKLGTDRDKAFARYHELMTRPQLPVVTATEVAKLVAVVIDAFLDYVYQHRSPHIR